MPQARRERQRKPLYNCHIINSACSGEQVAAGRVTCRISSRAKENYLLGRCSGFISSGSSGRAVVVVGDHGSGPMDLRPVLGLAGFLVVGEARQA
jgi:hypothetical protein